MRIAVIGGGAAGLVAARELSADHEVTLYEASDRAGGHCVTERLVVGGQLYDIDLGVCTYFPRAYPNYQSLLAELGLKTFRLNGSISQRNERLGMSCRARVESPLILNWKNLIQPEWWSFPRDLARLWQCGRRCDRLPLDYMVGDLIAEVGFSDQFVDLLIFQFLNFTFGIDRGQMLDLPASFLLMPLRNWDISKFTTRRGMWAVRGGFEQCTQTLAAQLQDKLLLGTPVERLVRTTAGVEVIAADGGADRFDAVVLAVPAHQVLPMLDQPSEQEQQLFELFHYEPIELVLHRDRNALGKLEPPWAAINSRVLEGSGTGNMDIHVCPLALQGLKIEADLFLSHFASIEPDPDLVINRRRFYHLIPTLQTEQARNRWHSINGKNRTYYCGSYWGDMLHEAAVTSGLVVARSIGSRAMVA